MMGWLRKLFVLKPMPLPSDTSALLREATRRAGESADELEKTLRRDGVAQLAGEDPPRDRD